MNKFIKVIIFSFLAFFLFSNMTLAAMTYTDSGNDTATSSWDVSNPALSTGDMVIFNIGWDDGTDTTGLTPPSGPNGETAVVIEDVTASASTAVRGKIVYYIATGSWSSGTITFTPSASEQWTASVIKVPAGQFDSSTPIGAHDNLPSTTTGNPSLPSLTAGSTDRGGTVVGFIVSDVDNVDGVASGWTSRSNVDRGNDAEGLFTRDALASNSENISSASGWTFPTARNWVSFIYIIRTGSPSVTLNSPSDTSSTYDSTPDLVFTGTDPESDDVEYEVQIDNAGFATGAISRIGSAGNFTDTSNSSTHSVTVETGADLFVIGIEGYIPVVNPFSSGTLTLGGNTMTLARADEEQASGYDKTSVWYIVNPPTGTQTLAWDWAGDIGFADGGRYIYASYSGVDTDNPVKSNGGGAVRAVSADTTVSTALMPASTGDMVFSSVYTYNATNPTGLTWTNSSTLYYDSSGGSAGGAGEGFPTGNIVVSVNDDGGSGSSLWTTLSSVVFRAGTVVGVLDAFSTDETGFSAGASHPTASGVQQTYTVQSALDPDTYYWRVRAIDPSGSNTYGDWSSTYSLTVSSVTTPTVTTPTQSSIGTTSATLGANVTSDGGATITARGTCWGTTANPTGNCSSESGTTGVFTGTSSGTMPSNTLIYFRGYATNSAGTSYSADDSFTTETIPTITLPTKASITDTTATLGATLTDSSSIVTARGTCWDTTSSPTANCVSSGTATGAYSSERTGLPSGTLIYYRGYATYTDGAGASDTVYGSDDSFTTLSATYEQSGYRVFNNSNSLDVGSSLASENTSVTLDSPSVNFRIRLLLHVGSSSLSQSGQNFKLQYALKSGTCDTSFTGESYADVTSQTPMAYYNNFYATDGSNLTDNVNDPTHTTDTVVNQTYIESNNFTNGVSLIASGQDGEWDFSLYYKGAESSVSYCFRVIKSDDSLLDTYSVIPEVITAVYKSRTGGVVSDLENPTTPDAAVTGGTDKTGGSNLDLPQCSDTTDNDTDTFIDSLDPECHLDGSLGNEYIPSWNSESTAPVSNTGGGQGDTGGDLGFLHKTINKIFSFKNDNTLKSNLRGMVFNPLINL